MKKISKTKMTIAQAGVIVMGLGLCAADSEGIGMWIAIGMIFAGMGMMFPAHQEWMEIESEEEWE